MAETEVREQDQTQGQSQAGMDTMAEHYGEGAQVRGG